MNENEVVQLFPRRLKGSQGNSYDRLVEAVYRDSRVGPARRELILTVMWVCYKDPGRTAATTVWSRLNEIYGVARNGQPEVAARLAEDLPRYVPDTGTGSWMLERCQAPLKTREGVCGVRTRERTMRTDPRTGWWEPVWYCGRHAEFGDHIRLESKLLGKIDPVPNRGGLLPVFLRHRLGDEGWERLYAWAAGWTRTRWKPSPYGFNANLWPASAATAGGSSELRLVPVDKNAKGVDI